MNRAALFEVVTKAFPSLSKYYGFNDGRISVEVLTTGAVLEVGPIAGPIGGHRLKFNSKGKLVKAFYVTKKGNKVEESELVLPRMEDVG